MMFQAVIAKKRKSIQMAAIAIRTLSTVPTCATTDDIGTTIQRCYIPLQVLVRSAQHVLTWGRGWYVG